MFRAILAVARTPAALFLAALLDSLGAGVHGALALGLRGHLGAGLGVCNGISTPDVVVFYFI